MGYSILYFYFLYPFASFLCGMILGTQKNRWKYLAPLIFGVVGVLIPYLISQSTDGLFFVLNFIPGVLGIGIGAFIKKSAG